MRGLCLSACVVPLALICIGCGDDTASSASAGSTTTVTTAPPTAGDSSSGGGVPTGSGEEDGTLSAGATVATTSDVPTTDSTGISVSTSTGVFTTTTPGTSSGGTTVGLDDTGLTTGTTGDDTTGGGNCDVQCGNSDWSYVWIANSGEHTLTKLDTRTMTEEGRYYTRPDQQGSPSRTSVSIDGRAVAVANRLGGVTKYWARKEFCTDKNGNGQIDTSVGKNNVLPFGQDECLAWYTAFPQATTQRPVAWTSGVYNLETCEYDDQKIWVAAANGTPNATWPCDGSPGIFVYRLNGDTGAVEETIPMPDVSCGGTLGPYGAAVDANNDLWMYVWSSFTIVHVDHDTLDYETLQGGSYGITVDKKGRVWVDSGQRYDPVTKMWASQIGNQPGNGGSGVAEDLQGRIWKATNGGVGWVNSDTMQVGDTVLLPMNGLARGVGVDIDGYIWAVMLGGTTAYRIHPDTYEIAEYNGLNQPYTYSDMAGGQINKVVCPQ